MPNNYIYADVSSVISFTFAAGQFESPLLVASPNNSGDQTGTKALRALAFPSNFPTATLKILASPDANGSRLFYVLAVDGVDAAAAQIPITNGTPQVAALPPHWSDWARSFVIQSSVAMPDDISCLAILQPIYKGGAS